MWGIVMAGGKTPVRAWSHVRNRRTDADGKRRPATRRRQPLAMSVVALLVVIALAAGVGCGFLLVRPAIPPIVAILNGLRLDHCGEKPVR